MDLDLSVRVTRNEAIIFTEPDDTVMTMDVEDGRYYELDPMGARTWALLESEQSVAEAARLWCRRARCPPIAAERTRGHFLRSWTARV